MYANSVHILKDGNTIDLSIVRVATQFSFQNSLLFTDFSLTSDHFPDFTDGLTAPHTAVLIY